MFGDDINAKVCSDSQIQNRRTGQNSQLITSSVLSSLPPPPPQLKRNLVLKEQLQNLNYKTFEKLTSTVQNLVAPAGQAAGPDCLVEQQKIAWAFEVTSRLSAVGVVHHRRVLNFGAQYIEKNHADWVRQRGGWVS